MRPRQLATITLCVAVSTSLQLANGKPVFATGFGSGGCASAGGGDTTGISATNSCGLPPPASPTPQDNGPGIAGPAVGPSLGSPCIPTQKLPGVGNPGRKVPSDQYIIISPAITGNPGAGLTASGTIHSALPIGSPDGPHDVAVPPEPVKTAGQQNGDAAAAAQGIANEYNADQPRSKTPSLLELSISRRARYKGSSARSTPPPTSTCQKARLYPAQWPRRRTPPRGHSSSLSISTLELSCTTSSESAR